MWQLCWRTYQNDWDSGRCGWVKIHSGNSWFWIKEATYSAVFEDDSLEMISVILVAAAIATIDLQKRVNCGETDRVREREGRKGRGRRELPMTSKNVRLSLERLSFTKSGSHRRKRLAGQAGRQAGRQASKFQRRDRTTFFICLDIKRKNSGFWWRCGFHILYPDDLFGEFSGLYMNWIRHVLSRLAWLSAGWLTLFGRQQVQSSFLLFLLRCAANSAFFWACAGSESYTVSQSVTHANTFVFSATVSNAVHGEFGSRGPVRMVGWVTLYSPRHVGPFLPNGRPLVIIPVSQSKTAAAGPPKCSLFARECERKCPRSRDGRRQQQQQERHSWLFPPPRPHSRLENRTSSFSHLL